MLQPADPLLMEVGLKSAFMKAGLKLAGGLFLVAAVLGIRIVVATPEGVEAEIAELEQVEAELAAAQATSGPGAKTSAPAEATRSSRLTRFGADVRARFTGAAKGPPDGERLVSCRLEGGVQFMRAADCGTRGGKSTDLD